MEEFSDIIEFLNGEIEYMKEYIEKLESENLVLNKELDKACGLLAEAVCQDCSIFDEVLVENYIWRDEREYWKDWLRNNV